MVETSLTKGRDHFDPVSWSLKDWKRIQWEVTAASVLMCSTPCFIFSLWIRSNGDGEADAIIYDSTHYAGSKRIYIDTVDESAFQLNWWPPLYFAQALWIQIGTNVSRLGVQYLPEPRM